MKGLAGKAREEQSSSGNVDLDIGYGLLVSALLEPDGQQALQEALSQENPVPVIAGMISTLIKEIAQRLEGTEVDIDRNVWLQKGGVVDKALDMLGETAGLQEEVQAAVFSDVVDQIKLLSNQNKQRQMQGAQQAPQGLAGAAQQQPMMGGM